MCKEKIINFKEVSSSEKLFGPQIENPRILHICGGSANVTNFARQQICGCDLRNLFVDYPHLVKTDLDKTAFVLTKLYKPPTQFCSIFRICK
jgi:hypothetical protein